MEIGHTMQKTLVVLLGPTGIGKTELSLHLSDFLGKMEGTEACPILNCDSRQLFRDLHIGTAAPTPEQLQVTKHYFVGTLALDEYYSAAQYETEALSTLDTIFKERNTALLSGGSMLYIDAVCKGIDDIPTVDDTTRTLMKQRLADEGLERLVEELKSLDPEYYAIADLHNTRRIVHALEICHMTGRTYTSFRTNKQAKRPFRILKIGLQRPREELFARINQRVDLMMEEGLLDEVKANINNRHLNALNTVGYKELFAYLDGIMPLTIAVERIKKNTRVYAKKQMTWFAKDDSINWFHPDQEDKIKAFITENVEL